MIGWIVVLYWSTSLLLAVLGTACEPLEPGAIGLYIMCRDFIRDLAEGLEGK